MVVSLIPINLHAERGGNKNFFEYFFNETELRFRTPASRGYHSRLYNPLNPDPHPPPIIPHPSHLMHELNIAIVLAAALVLVLSAVSRLLNRLWVSELIIATAAGVLVGPHALGVLDPAAWGDKHAILEQAARITLAIALMGVALRLPQRYIARHWRPAAMLIGPVMLLMWIVSGLLAWGLLRISFWEAALIGAIVTPTDPVLASTIVTGTRAERLLPPRVRHNLSVESGANDGLAYLLVLLPVLLLTRSTGEALSHWALHTLMREVIAGIFFGAVIGYIAAKGLSLARARNDIQESSFLAYTVALALVVLAGAKLLGMNGILAVFLAGRAFAWGVRHDVRERQEHTQEAVTRLFILPVFVLLGMTLPWEKWWELGWRAPAIVAAILLLRRLPAVLALHPWIEGVHTRPRGWFIGWFGPIGVAALFYANLAHRHTHLDITWTVPSLIITASVLAHGITATPLTNRLGRSTDRETDGE